MGFLANSGGSLVIPDHPVGVTLISNGAARRLRARVDAGDRVAHLPSVFIGRCGGELTHIERVVLHYERRDARSASIATVSVGAKSSEDLDHDREGVAVHVLRVAVCGYIFDLTPINFLSFLATGCKDVVVWVMRIFGMRCMTSPRDGEERW
jgi:hypothetical protein